MEVFLEKVTLAIMGVFKELKIDGIYVKRGTRCHQNGMTHIQLENQTCQNRQIINE